jgi:hypothetical protein
LDGKWRGRGEVENAKNTLLKMEEANALRLQTEITKYIAAAGRMEKIVAQPGE